MSAWVALLLLWGFTLGPATDGAVFVSTQPSLWAEPESLLEPWANLTLTCEAYRETQDFQLLKNGVVQEQVRVGFPVIKYHFPLGTVTSNNRGLYGCQTGLSFAGVWTELSNLLEVTGTEPLPQPGITTQPVSWITPGLDTKLLCKVGLRGVIFLLRREGDAGFLEVSEVAKDGYATFPVHQPGNYSCSYQTHPAGKPSEPSATVTIKEYATPPPPELSYGKILRPITHWNLVCVGPLSNAEFQLRQGEKDLKVPRSSTYPELVFFHLKLEDMGDHGPVTCRYRLRSRKAAWSADSEPLELIWSDETLPAPVLTVEPEGSNPEPGSRVQLRCTAPKAGLSFALKRENWGQHSLLQILKPTGTEAVFQLPGFSVADSGNYSCFYSDLAPPFAGSAPSTSLELSVDGS
ncbi:alpha-1B-glycoprotein isoform X1 [Nannospalax galili]|uniref:alpha-1B-glycoprotein isoform X1 n=1 Tax=Nannospalax galili TaxID=1026970 RepID=UPI00111C2D6D|nr:alpha-1B-glycoprotein isoform X1 [Nannospalax galili]